VTIGASTSGTSNAWLQFGVPMPVGPSTTSFEGGMKVFASSGNDDRSWSLWADAHNPRALRINYLGDRALSVGGGTAVATFDYQGHAEISGNLTASQFHTAEFELADLSSSYLNVMSGHSTNSGLVFQTSGNSNNLGYILGQHDSVGGLDNLGFLDQTGNWAFNIISEAGTGDDYTLKTAVFHGNARPSADAGSNLGSATKRWLGLYSSRVFNADGNAGAPSYTFANDTDIGMYRRATNTLSFATDGDYRAEFASDGDLHIGTTGAVINNSAMVHIKAPTSYFGLTVWSQSSGWSALGVRNSSSGCTQSNNTECYAVAFYDNGGGIVGSIRIDDVADSVRYLTTSDYRLKENETALTGALDNILSLKPYTYNYIGDPNDTPVSGFFAHEVSDYIPQAISGVKDEVWGSDGPFDAGTAKHQGIDYGKMVPMLVGAIQELEERVADLEDGQGN
jgi:hypothetical protein